MSQDVFEAALTRMATDHAYTEAVQTDPASALDGLELTPDERATLVGLTHDAGSGLTALAPRSSKSALFFGSAIHDATAPVHHAATHMAGPSAGEQVVTWVTSMDHPGDADATPALASGTAQLLQGPTASQAAEEEIEELESELEADAGGTAGGPPPA
jgi:hypothetical protein